MPHLLEHFFRQLPHTVIIVDHKYTKPMRRLYPACSDLTQVGRGRCATKPQMNRSAFAQCAFDGSCPADLSREAIHHGKTQPTTLSGTLGREERIECLGHDVVRHARSCI